MDAIRQSKTPQLAVDIHRYISQLELAKILHVITVEEKDVNSEPLSLDHLGMIVPGKYIRSQWCMSIQGGDCSLDAYLVEVESEFSGQPTHRWVYEVIQHSCSAATREQPADEDATSLLTTTNLAEALGLLIGQASQTFVEGIMEAEAYD